MGLPFMSCYVTNLSHFLFGTFQQSTVTLFSPVYYPYGIPEVPHPNPTPEGRVRALRGLVIEPLCT